MKVQAYWRKPYQVSLKSRFQDFVHRIVVLVRRALIVTAFGFALYGAAWAGSTFWPNTVYATREVPVPVEGTAPVMERIAKAESGNSHFCTTELIKNGMCKKGELGQVLLHANKNGTVDIGKYQINLTVWGAKATEQKLNLFNEKDNETFAYWLYKNYGTEPWYSSKENW